MTILSVKYLDNYITLCASLMTFATITWELVRFRVHTSYYQLSLAISGISSMAEEVSAKFAIEVFPDATSSVANGSAWSRRAELLLSSSGALFGELLNYSSALTARGSEQL